MRAEQAVRGSIKGSCLCGALAFEISGKYGPIGQCHCSKCRKVSGTDGNAVFYAAFDGFHWLRGQDNVQTYSHEANWPSKFCTTCGSPAPFANKEKKFYFVPAGLLDDDPGSRGYAAHIHVSSKAAWHEIADAAPQYSEGFGSTQL